MYKLNLIVSCLVFCTVLAVTEPARAAADSEEELEAAQIRAELAAEEAEQLVPDELVQAILALDPCGFFWYAGWEVKKQTIIRLQITEAFLLVLAVPVLKLYWNKFLHSSVPRSRKPSPLLALIQNRLWTRCETLPMEAFI